MTRTEKKSLFLAVGAAAALWFGKRALGIKVAGIGAARKYYVYAGYYENYISSEPMPAPYILRKTFRSIDRAIEYAESFGDTVIYCDNVRNDIPDFMREALDEANEFFTYEIGKVKKYPYWAIIIRPLGSYKRPIIYGEYRTQDEADKVYRNLSHIILRSSTVQLLEIYDKEYEDDINYSTFFRR